MPAPDSFVDTNILLYAISTDPTEAEKSTVARNLLMTANWAWSAQVAAEFVNASTSALCIAGSCTRKTSIRGRTTTACVSSIRSLGRTPDSNSRPTTR